MKKARLAVLMLVTLSFTLLSSAVFAQNNTSKKKEAAQIAVQLGYLNYHAHTLKNALTDNDNQIKKLSADIVTDYTTQMKAYLQKASQMSMGDLMSGKGAPQPKQDLLKKLAEALLKNQNEFTVDQVDEAISEQTTLSLLSSQLTEAAQKIATDMLSTMMGQ